MKGASSISYLQAKVLEVIYLNLFEKKKTSIEEISDATHYKKDSKILLNAINSIAKKGYINGDLENGFSMPNGSEHLQELIIKNNLKKELKYSSIFNKGGIELPDLIAPDTSKFLKEMDQWYSYVEEFSSELILTKIKDQNLKRNALIYDPFIGSGTTAIAANLLKHNSIGIDANPLMVEVSGVKTNWSLDTKKLVQHLEMIDKKFLKNIYKKIDVSKSFSNMPAKELDQWLSLKNQKEIGVLKKIILEIKDKEIRRFFLVCMSKSAFDTSYVALCPGTTFYPFRKKQDFWSNFGDKAISKIKQLMVINSFFEPGSSKFINDNCINVKKHLSRNCVDFAFTSPPYPNDLEYTRQTRLELYLLDMVSSMEDVSKIKKDMVKSSTKLIYKDSNSAEFIESNKVINNLTRQISKKLAGKDWGWDYPRMVKEYFGDMYLCLKNTKVVLKKDAYFMLVCGDQTIQGVFLPVCDILVEIGKELGYKKSYKEPYRIRRSTTHNKPLPEDIVILQK